MPRSSSSSSSSSSTDRASSSDDEEHTAGGGTSRRQRTTSEQSGENVSTKSDERPKRKTRRRSESQSQSQSDDKSTKQETRGNRDHEEDAKGAKAKSDGRRRRKDDSTQPERGEKRHGDAATSHKAKSSKDVDYSEKLSKPEPKFEPRISMYKYDPLQGVMSETAQYNDHRHRLSRARSLIDNKPPPNFGHVQQNMKRLKEKQEREDEIEKGNQRLLVRLVKAMTTKRIDNWNEVDNRLVKTSREKERQRILQMAAENRKIAQRIEARQCTINSNREAGAAGPAGPQPQRRAGRAANGDRSASKDD